MKNLNFKFPEINHNTKIDELNDMIDESAEVIDLCGDNDDDVIEYHEDRLEVIKSELKRRVDNVFKPKLTLIQGGGMPSKKKKKVKLKLLKVA